MTDLSSDIVVIGAGGAGLAAAVAAAELGANVIVLEKRRAAGGNTAMATGLFAAESLPQKRLGIDASRDVLFKMAMDYSHWTIDPNIVRAFIDKSADTIQWLEDKGAKLDYLPAMHNGQALRTWHCHPERAGPHVVRALLKSCEDLGVRLLYETASKRVLVSGKGAVTGVRAATKGEESKIAAGSVLIGTGGYAGNKELLMRYCPRYTEDIQLRGVPNTGDGLLMATEAGAATEGLGLLMMSGPAFRGTRYADAIAREPNTIWVNRKGERFIDESFPWWPEIANALARQPGSVSYTLFDEKLKQGVIDKGTIKGAEPVSPPQTRLSELGKELLSEANQAAVKVSGSWDDIAAWIGAAPEVLQATIDEYNSFCDRGHDEALVKDRRYLQPLRTPPYYALKCGLSFLVTLGGIKINHHMQVLDGEGNPIPGLYAMGNDAGGWESDTYDLALTGGGFGFAINSGRIAGEHAAKNRKHK